jgi:hypothetical protein
MARKNYSIDEVLRWVLKNPKISLKGDVLTCTNSNNPDDRFRIGNGTRGKIDFLSRNGYTVIWVAEDSIAIKSATDKLKIRAKGLKFKVVTVSEQLEQNC